MVPSDTSEFSATGQNKDTVMATRSHDATDDRPDTVLGIANKLTLAAWFQTDDLRASPTNYTIIAKGSAVYTLVIQGPSAVRADIDGVTGGGLSTETDLVVPGVPLHIATTFDGAEAIWKVFVNGVVVASRALASGQVVGHSAGGTLQIGGYNAFGAAGIHGRMQHVSIFNAHALSDEAIQGLYAVGRMIPGVEGDFAAYAFPWNRQIVGVGGPHTYIDFENWSDVPVTVSPGGAAVPGAGYTLAPRGGRLPKPSKFKGAWSAAHAGLFGEKLIGIHKS
jgi:hypothetical protein